MKKTIYLFLLVSIFSCSSDEPQVNTAPAPANFQINAVVSSSVVVVDQEFTVTISSEQQMTGIFFSFDNFVTEYGSNSDYGTSKTLKFNLDDIGVTTLYFKAKKSNNVSSSIIAVPITVNRGNAVKVIGIPDSADLQSVPTIRLKTI